MLVVVILLLLTTFALGHGLLLMARQQLLVARAGARQLETRMAADAAVHAAIDRGGGTWMDSVAAWGLGPRIDLDVGRAGTSTVLRRLGLESWLVEASASLPGQPPTSAARLVWSVDPVARVTDLSAVVTVGPSGAVVLAGAVVGAGFTAVEPPLADTLCEPWRDGLAVGIPTDSVGPVHVVADTTLDRAVGELSFDRIASVGLPVPDSSGTPAAVERLGVCDDGDPWNWGDPDRPYRPCGGHLPVLVRRGPLSVQGGTGQGVLLVDGNLVLSGQSRIYGLVITTGAAVLRDDARLTGALIALGDVRVGTAARVRGSACWVARSVASIRSRVGFIVRDEPLGPY